MKGYSTFPKALALLKPYHQIVLCHYQETHGRNLTPMKRCRQCILQPQPIGLSVYLFSNHYTTGVRIFNCSCLESWFVGWFFVYCQSLFGFFLPKLVFFLFLLNLQRFKLLFLLDNHFQKQLYGMFWYLCLMVYPSSWII